MQTCRRVVLFGAGASFGARPELDPPVGQNLHEYVGRYLEKKFPALREWDSYDVTTDSVTASHGVRNKLKHLLVKAQSFERLANRLSHCHERDLLAKLNFLMACAMTPPIFPLIPDDEPRVNDAFIEQHDVSDAFLQRNFATSEERHNASFITLNYDCLLERAICRSFFNGPQDGESRCRCTHVNYRIKSSESKGIEVLKPHGSINWVGNILGGGPNLTSVNYVEPEPDDDRPSYTDIDIVSSLIGKSGDPDGLVIATYATGKNPQTNPKLLFDIQNAAKSRMRDAAFVEIIGVHLPKDSGDDPFLWSLLELLAEKVKAHCQVIYVNPDKNEIERARGHYRFEAVAKTFRDYVNSAGCLRR